MTTRLDEVAYIYGLRDKNQSSYFYVGSTYKSPDLRLKAHLNEVVNGYHKNKHFVNKIKKIGIDNVVIDTLAISNAKDRWIIERDWIRKLVNEGHRLVNRIHNGIEFKIINGKLTKEEYENIYRFIQSPLFDESNIIHLCLKEAMSFLGQCGNLLQDYFDSDDILIFNEPELLWQLKQLRQ